MEEVGTAKKIMIQIKKTTVMVFILVKVIFVPTEDVQLLTKIVMVLHAMVWQLFHFQPNVLHQIVQNRFQPIRGYPRQL